ncbi:hypothetical protein OHA25_16340 [Nonomuraea sp. NBC_00507]|uniref:hypothetical protein n=1 Tax=Nonomuraea sp. NBC_00507 TaxID=2976002 RepID=UPI002E17323E
MWLLARFGLSARMSPGQCAEVVIEMDAANAELDFAALTVPTMFVVGTGAHPGAGEEEVRTMRAATSVAIARNELVSVFATSPANHVRLLAKDTDTVVAAIEAVTTACRART